MTEQVEQWICIKFCIKLEYSSVETIQMIQKVSAMGSWRLAASSQHTCSCVTSPAEVFGETSNHPSDSAPNSPDLTPCDFKFFPKLKSPLKGKTFQTIKEIQKNMMGQLMAIGRIVWGPMVPTLRGTEASLSYVQCLLYLVSSSRNAPIFHSTRMDTFWTDLLCWTMTRSTTAGTLAVFMAHAIHGPSMALADRLKPLVVLYVLVRQS